MAVERTYNWQDLFPHCIESLKDTNIYIYLYIYIYIYIYMDESLYTVYEV